MLHFPVVLIPNQIKKVQATNFEKHSNLPTINPQEDTFFWYYLEKLFPNKVKRGYLFHSYTPDFIYFDPINGLHIDIELDEPYVYDTKEPTHYQTPGNEGDNIRNQFFLNHGWVVIRFSEEQIVCYPDSCCKAIAQVVASISKDYTILEQFTNIPDLPFIPQWTREEAIEMAQNNYRDTYLLKEEPNLEQNLSPTLQLSHNTLIDTLKRFINVEADTQVRQVRETWLKFLEERVQDGYAIADIEISGDRAKLRCQQNISKFDKGDQLLLNRGNPLDKNNSYICVLEEEKDNELFISAGYKVSFDSLFPSQGWVLDRDLIDVREIMINTLNALAYSPARQQYILGILGGQVKPVMDFAKVRLSEELFSKESLKNQKEAFIGAFATENYYLIQGPPGTGKTWLLAHIATSLARQGQRVLITAFTHTAINNALQKIVKTTDYSHVIKIGQYDRIDGLNWENGFVANYEKFKQTPYQPDAQGLIVGATCYALRTSRLQEVQFDTVIFDESGQVTLPLAIAGMMSGQRYIFIGDHKQMPPVIVGRHSEQWVTRSVFETLFNHTPGTMLDVTHRMNAEINDFPSKYFYEGRLTPSDHARARRLQLTRMPMRYGDVLDPSLPSIFR